MKEGFLGIDVGGTFIKAGFLFEDRIISKKEFKTLKNTINEFMENLRTIIKQYREEYRILSCGIGLPGVFNTKTNIMHNAVHIEVLNGKNLIKELSIYDIPVYFDNDANFAGYGEYSYLSHKEKEKYKNLVFLTLGTGVGMGIIIDGKLYRGKMGFIEGGHITIDPYGKECTCGNKGCLETVVSSTGLLSTYRRIKEENLTDTKELLKRAKNGEKEALLSYKEFGATLGIGLATINNILNPDLIVLGGGLSYHHEFFLHYAIETLKERSYTYKYSKPEIKISKLGNLAGLFGAAHYAKEMFKKNSY